MRASTACNVLFRHGGTWWVDVRKDSAWISAVHAPRACGRPDRHPGRGGVARRWRRVGGCRPRGDSRRVRCGSRAAGPDRSHQVPLRVARCPGWRCRSGPMDGAAAPGPRDQRELLRDVAVRLRRRSSAPACHSDPEYTTRGPAPLSFRQASRAYETSAAPTGRRRSDGAENAMVSFPLLINEGTLGATLPSQWLANRTFIGQDRARRIIVGTTRDAFFSL